MEIDDAVRITEKPSKFTARELEIIRMLVSGFSDDGMSRLLNRSTRTIATHVRNVYEKLDIPDSKDVNPRSLAILRLLASGIISIEGRNAKQ
ncbi:response regulator transcription factor [Methylovulum psychrotolerans]|jgi:DNA-binding NarL/FixJ family response regulator|uniref:HTH luxR-type domain-containing protein n=1 Tax=Methylovulum psychrotolerans TaxID=1704499 RepID=A0A1Z4BV69_9GAMM|nr:LuxR C-terminal-related transcriptional regulator [Methylovulum psychrotolerans]ASF45204.1 hypothetical protein CEK71_03530 [Methylovulum psychrotolerans]